MILYKRKGFIIVECGNKRKHYYTVVNKNSRFKGQHTHVSTFDEAKFVLNCAIHNDIPTDSSQYLQESVKRLIIKDYHGTENEEHYETVFSYRYKTFCRKLDKKKKYYDDKHIIIVFLKLHTYDGNGYKARIIPIHDEKEYSKKELWKKTSNGLYV